MRALRVLIFIIMNITNYALVLLGVFCYKCGSLILFPLFLIIQTLLVIANFFTSTKIWQLSVLSVNLLISTILCIIFQTHLYAINVAAGETYLVGKGMLLVGCAYVIGLSIAAIILKRDKIKNS